MPAPRTPHNPAHRITPHVRRTGRQPDTNAGRRNNHRRSTVNTRRRVAMPISCPTLIDVPSGSVISILPSDTCSSLPADDGSTGLVPLPFAGSLIVCTGKNTGGDSGLRTPRRIWLRQFHNSPRLISYLRAISAMPKPGCSVSATIRSFSSRLQRRRRSTVTVAMAAHTNSARVLRRCRRLLNEGVRGDGRHGGRRRLVWRRG